MKSCVSLLYFIETCIFPKFIISLIKLSFNDISLSYTLLTSVSTYSPFFLSSTWFLYAFKVLKSYEDVNDIDFAIISPGISRDNELLVYLNKQGVKVENELDFASKFIKGEIVSVTGTNGKSTVVSLINLSKVRSPS